MGCIITQSEISQPELVLNIRKEKEALILLDERLSTYFKLNFIINIQTPLTESIYRNLKEMLANLHKSLASSKETLNYYLMINFDQNLLESEVSFKMFRDFTFFLHFTASKFNRRLNCEFKFSNVLLTYKNLTVDSCEIKWSLIHLQEFNINLIKELSLKYHFENFLLFNETELSLNSVLNVLFENIHRNYKCLILPPILIQENELHKLLEKLSKLKLDYLEIQLKLDINNFHKLKTLMDVLAKFIIFFENMTVSLIFYNTKCENIQKVSELSLNLIPVEIFFSQNESRIFLFKLFFVIYEANTVDYKYYVFKGNVKKSKKSLLRCPISIDPKQIKQKIYLIIQRKLNGNIQHKTKIYKSISEFLFFEENLSSKSILIEKDSENLDSPNLSLDQLINNQISSYQKKENLMMKSSSLINEKVVQPELASSSTLAQEKNLTFMRRMYSLTPSSKKKGTSGISFSSDGRKLLKETNSDGDQTNLQDKANFYLSEYQSRKFFIEDLVESKNFNLEYNSKLIEFYKKPW
jgi:hypothetical protein